MEEKTLKDKVDYAYDKLKEQEEQTDKKKDKIGYSNGFVTGIIIGVIIFFISIFLWTFWWAVVAGIAACLVITFFVGNMGWQPWIPFGAKVGKRKVRNQYVIVLKMGYNKGATFERQQIKDGTILVDGIPRPVYDNNIALYKGKKPMVVAFSWRIPLLDFSEDYEKSFAAGLGTKGWRLLISRIKSESIVEKKGISGMIIFLIIAAIGAGGYFAFKGGWF